MDGRRLGRLSLRVDALYCASVAVIVGGAAGWWSGAAGITSQQLRWLALAVAVWAAVLWRMSTAARLEHGLWFVRVANVAGAVALVVAAARVPSVALGALLVAVSVEVLAFAASQGRALRAYRTPPMVAG